MPPSVKRSPSRCIPDIELHPVPVSSSVAVLMHNLRNDTFYDALTRFRENDLEKGPQGQVYQVQKIPNDHSTGGQ